MQVYGANKLLLPFWLNAPPPSLLEELSGYERLKQVYASSPFEVLPGRLLDVGGYSKFKVKQIIWIFIKA